MDLELDFRPITGADAQALRLMMGSPTLREWLYPSRSPRVDVGQAVEDWLADSDRRLAFMCTCIVAREPAGVVRLDGRELAFAVAEPWQRQGIATRMVSLLLQRLGPGKVVAWVERDNIGSRLVLERNGFRFAGLDHPPGSCPRLLYVADR